jgi:DNA-binding MarR family transcriptional regulator
VLGDWSEVQKAWCEPGTVGENLRFQDFPAFHLITLANLAKAVVSRACLEPAGLSIPAWRLLTTLVAGAPVPFAHVATLTMMDKGQISRTLRTAQSKGLVVTDVVPLDRRPVDTGFTSIGRVMVRITPQGRDVYMRVMPEAQRSQLRLIQLMSEEERLLLVDLSRRIHERLTADLREQT